MTSTPFDEGLAAHERGALRTDCPYPQGSSRCAEWSEGWRAALKARFGDAQALPERPDGSDQDEGGETGLPDDEDSRILGDLPKEA